MVLSFEKTEVKLRQRCSGIVESLDRVIVKSLNR